MKRQSGMSVNAVLVLLVLVGFGAKVFVSLMPMYFDYQMMKQVIDTLHESNTFTERTTERDVRKVMEQRVSANNLEIPLDNLKVDRSKGVLKVSLDYEVKAHFIANLSFVGEFSFHEEF
ncbi:DUF4845 domain-containing protein [Oceanobacter mangrovi]|uniref:DUF4845 domain-containing protein n=1 Tax=Oceanobacter mangrovi TaxID=2862510 RepID=UPI001C8EF910|nr:DUF4845 domain-containing protein [Oceanobacter mangrovi]